MGTKQQEKKKPHRRTANRLSDEILAAIQIAAAKRGIVGKDPVAKYNRMAIFEQLRRDGFAVAEASK